MEEQPASLRVEVAVGPDADAEEIAQATLRLRRELLDLDAVEVKVPRGGEPPPGSRAVDLAALGALVVNVARAAAAHRCAGRGPVLAHRLFPATHQA